MALPNISGELSYYPRVSDPNYHFDIKKHYPTYQTVTPATFNSNVMSNVMDDMFVTYLDCVSERMTACEPLVYPNYLYRQWHGARYHCVYYKHKNDSAIMIFDGHNPDNKINMVGVINGDLHVISNNTHFSSSAFGTTMNLGTDLDFNSILKHYKNYTVKFLFEMAKNNVMLNHP